MWHEETFQRQSSELEGIICDCVVTSQGNVYTCIVNSQVIFMTIYVERNGSGVELQTLGYENPGSNPVLRC